jgi:hypothetical protein
MKEKTLSKRNADGPVKKCRLSGGAAWVTPQDRASSGEKHLPEHLEQKDASARELKNPEVVVCVRGGEVMDWDRRGNGKRSMLIARRNWR